MIQVLHREDPLGIRVGDGDVKGFFDGHDKLDGIQAHDTSSFGD